MKIELNSANSSLAEVSFAWIVKTKAWVTKSTWYEIFVPWTVKYKATPILIRPRERPPGVNWLGQHRSDGQNFYYCNCLYKRFSLQIMYIEKPWNMYVYSMYSSSCPCRINFNSLIGNRVWKTSILVFGERKTCLWSNQSIRCSNSMVRGRHIVISTEKKN